MVLQEEVHSVRILPSAQSFLTGHKEKGSWLHWSCWKPGVRMTIPRTAKLPAAVTRGLAGREVQADQVSRVAVLGSGSLENSVD